MTKMMRRRKEWVRCTVPGHGQSCEVCDDARGPIIKEQERREARQEIQDQLDEIEKDAYHK